MSTHSLTKLFTLAALLSGCQSQVPGTVPPPQTQSFSVRETVSQAPPKVLSESQVRRLMQVAGTASLWGVRYTQTHSSGARYAYRRGPLEYYSNYSGSAPLSGKGELTRVSYNRYLYRVPADQVLVLNSIEGNGTIYLNGYGLGAGLTRTIHYLFGPGEDVVFNFAPNYSNSRGNDYGNTYYNNTYYHPVAISGFTVSPSLLNGMGVLGGAK